MWHGRAAYRLPVMAGALLTWPIPAALAAHARTRGTDPDVWPLATAPPVQQALADPRRAARR